MKRIFFSIIALAAFAYSSNAQTTVTQGSAVSSANHSNTVVLDQKIDAPGYSVTAHSSNSYLSVTQTQDASAVGNATEILQDGAYNYAHQIQNGANNYSKLTQYNGVVGSSWDDGSKAYLHQAGEGNELIAYQGVGSSSAGMAGNHLYASQSGINGSLHVHQSSEGTGNYANLTQGAATEHNFQSIQQWGSDNYVQTSQVSGLGNYIFAFQHNNDATAAGNTLVLDQRGGNGNIISWKQEGSNLWADIKQNGNDNKAGASNTGIEQGGIGHKASVTQNGDFNFVRFNQKEQNNEIVLTQSGNSNSFTADQAGSNNSWTIMQTRNNSSTNGVQMGSNNTATITQTGGY